MPFFMFNALSVADSFFHMHNHIFSYFTTFLRPERGLKQGGGGLITKVPPLTSIFSPNSTSVSVNPAAKTASYNFSGAKR